MLPLLMISRSRRGSGFLCYKETILVRGLRDKPAMFWIVFYQLSGRRKIPSKIISWQIRMIKKVNSNSLFQTKRPPSALQEGTLFLGFF